MISLAKTLLPSSCEATLLGPNTARPCSSNRSVRPDHERRLGTDDGEVDLLAAGEVEQRRQVVGGDGDVVGLGGGAGVARGAEDAVRERGLGEGMDEGVLSAAAAHHEHAHEASEWL